MFFHIFYYKLIEIFHSKDMLMWIFIFPLALGTLFYAGFGRLVSGASNHFHPIPIAVISETAPESLGELSYEQLITQKERDTKLLAALVKELSQMGSDRMFDSRWTTEEKAAQLLREKKVDAVLYIQSEPSLTILENGINQSITESFLSQYLSRSDMMQQIAAEHPERLTDAIAQLSRNVSYNREKSTSAAKSSSLIQYFYALIAMVCLYGNILGQSTSISLQPHLSALGARKNVSPVHKLQILLIEFLACVLANCLSVLLLLFYLIVILKLDLSDNLPYILAIGFVGSLIGVSFGMFIGSVGKWSQNTKQSLSMSIIMICCFLGGLMVNTMPNILEHSAPWVNRINPAALISDAFYSINILEDMARYQNDLIRMTIIAAVFCLLSYLMLRKKTAD